MSRTIIFLLGLIALALLIFLCVKNNASRIQDDVQSRTTNLLLSPSTDWAKVSVDGRHITLTGTAPSDVLREKAAKIASDVRGVVSVDDQIIVGKTIPSPAKTQSPYKTQFTKNALGVVLSGWVPDQAQRNALVQLAQQKFGADKVTDLLEIGSGAPSGWQESATLAITNLALSNEGTISLIDQQIYVSGRVNDDEAKKTITTSMQNQLPANFNIDFDLLSLSPKIVVEEIPSEPIIQSKQLSASCEEQFKQQLNGQVIHFSLDSSGIEAQAQTTLDKILQFSKACQNSIIEVAGHTDSQGNDEYNMILSKKRATAIVNNLINRGMRADRLQATGFGETQPLTDNDSQEGHANNRRIEFKYLREGE